MKIVSIVGARPQFIKAAMIQREIKHDIIHTGQHFDTNMSDVFFKELNLPEPTINLQIHSLSNTEMIRQMATKLREILTTTVLVYGDTNSTFAGALAAKSLGLKVIHIEAGVRSYNFAMQEEVNRMATDHLSDILCCPDVKAVINLFKEGVDQNKVMITGDVMIDAVRSVEDKLPKKEGKYILCTIHREENLNRFRLDYIEQQLESLDTKVILPIHHRAKLAYFRPDVEIIDSVGYLEMLSLIKNAQSVVTDSGGVQREAHYFGVPCVVMRKESEWDCGHLEQGELKEQLKNITATKPPKQETASKKIAKLIREL